MGTTILQQDIRTISEAVKEITGFGIEDIFMDIRTPARVMPAKSAICHYLHLRGYDFDSIANVLGIERTGIYYLLRRHDEMLFSESLYRRYITAFDQILTTNT